MSLGFTSLDDDVELLLVVHIDQMTKGNTIVLTQKMRK